MAPRGEIQKRKYMVFMSNFWCKKNFSPLAILKNWNLGFMSKFNLNLR